jgi:hypothetical protein
MAAAPALLDRPRVSERAAAPPRSLRIQLWSSNYDPEPSGIAPLSSMWAQAMQARGPHLDVVAAHPP